ncbi:hypothetical protein O0L34_g10192 [Tuta absoluta]|nr:hypothetical protein O0L34_g10192 [Tuta absoluta]
MQHLDAGGSAAGDARSRTRVRAARAAVLSNIVAIAAGDSVGPSVLEIINNLLTNLRASVARDSEKETDEKLYQEALINALGEFADHLPDFQKIDIMMFIVSKIPAQRKPAPRADTMLQSILLKSLLKVSSNALGEFADHLPDFQKIDIMMFIVSKIPAQRKPAPRADTMLQSILLKSLLKVSSNALGEFADHLPDFQKIDIMMFIVSKIPAQRKPAPRADTMLQSILLKSLLKVSSNALGEFADHLPDFQKIDIMMFIMSKIPAQRKPAPRADTMLQSILLKSLLKVSSNALGEFADHLPDFQKIDIMMFIVSKIPAQRKPAPRADTMLQSILLKSLLKVSSNALGEFADHLPDFQKIDIMMFIMSKIPAQRKPAPRADTMLQSILLKSLLKVSSNALGEFADHLPDFQKIDIMMFIMSKIPAQRKPAPRADTMLQSILLKSLLKVSSNALGGNQLPGLTPCCRASCSSHCSSSNALGEFADHLPDFQKIDIMMFIVSKIPAQRKPAPRADTMLQSILLKSLLKVGTTYKTTELSKAFPAAFLDSLLRLSSAADPHTRVLLQRILQRLLDRRSNAHQLATTTVEYLELGLTVEKCSRPDLIFFSKHGYAIFSSLYEGLQLESNTMENIEAIYTTIALLFIELASEETVCDMLQLVLAIQQSAISNPVLSVSAQCQLHAVAISLAQLLQHVLGLTRLADYLHKIVEARRDEAPHMLPPLCERDDHIASAQIPNKLPYLMIDQMALCEILKASGMEYVRLQSPSPYAGGSVGAAHRHSWVEAGITQGRDSLADITAGPVTEMDSANSSPGVQRHQNQTEQISLEALRRAATGPSEAEKREAERRKATLNNAFRTQPFDQLMHVTQPKYEIKDKLEEIFNSITEEPLLPRSGGCSPTPAHKPPAYATQSNNKYFPELFLY